MTTLDDNEAFRLEFVNRMATVLGMPAPPKPAPALKTVPGLPRRPSATRAASHRLLEAVHSAKGEINQLQMIINRYEALAKEYAVQRKGHRVVSTDEYGVDNDRETQDKRLDGAA